MVSHIVLGCHMVVNHILEAHSEPHISQRHTVDHRRRTTQKSWNSAFRNIVNKWVWLG